MKFFVKLLLVILFVPVSLVVILSSTIKFQFLNPNFWKNDFKNNNVYTDLSKVLKTYAENQTVKGGGKTIDLKVITDVITPNLIEDFIVHNIDNILGFVNGTKKELLAYIPINKIPKEFAPKSVGLNTEELPLTSLLSKFNIDVSAIPISQIAYFGTSVNYLLIGSMSILIILLVLMFLLTKSGDRFIAIGLSFVLTGIAVLSSVKILNLIALSINKNYINVIRLDEMILAILTPSILGEISKTWSWITMALLVVGIALFFLKKPLVKNSNNV